MFETTEGTIKPIAYVGVINNKRLLLVEYKQAPNPSKTGWWIPAPGVGYGEDPKEKAQKVCEDFGISIEDLKLQDVESFVLQGGWHFICHYVVKTNSEPKPHPNIKSYRWVTSDELSEMKDMAHGKWEIGVGRQYLEGN